MDNTQKTVKTALNKSGINKPSNYVKYPMLLGCLRCPFRDLCGGLHINTGLLNCLDLCCNKPDQCYETCVRNEELFITRWNNLGGFDFSPKKSADCVQYYIEKPVIPLIYHKGKRMIPPQISEVVLKLSDLVDFRKGELRFNTREEICEAYCVNTATRLILSGIDMDHKIDPWKEIENVRVKLFKQLKEIDIELITVPNFSMAFDRPRTGDLESMKQIEQIYDEIQSIGIACAIHPNGRTDKDFERWADLINERREIQIIAYEFHTGTKRADRFKWHCDKLAMISKQSNRQLEIIIRGAEKAIYALIPHFKRVIYIDGISFMKTVYRRKFVVGPHWKN